MQVLYNFSLVGMVILDFQICSSRFCIAARVMALRRMHISDYAGVWKFSYGYICLARSHIHPCAASNFVSTVTIVSIKDLSYV